MTDYFSDRYDYRPSPAKITVREEAPPSLRFAIPSIAEDAGMQPSTMRQVICQILLVKPDSNNWSEYPNIWYEVCWLMEDAMWYKVYDIAEALYATLEEYQHLSSQPAEKFEHRLNDFLVENGIGWELCNGKITHRGSEVFTKSTHGSVEVLVESDLQRSANEMREALRDISRRPDPDITGAIQHAMAALEATAREITGKPNATLGQIVPHLGLPSPLDKAVQKLWGYASDRARHVREHQNVEHNEAEFIVTVAGSLCAFLSSTSPDD